MAEARVHRRLAAILAADVVGYSRLMGEDETGTLAALNRHRTEFIHPTVSEYGGRIVKLMGDGALVEFPSVVDAVECAVAVQSGMQERNAGIPEDRRIAFRIGINLGDIIIDGDDIYGDGVNVAARLEAEAESGGICVSDDAYRQVAGKLDLAFEELGERDLKNIAEPVRVCRWSVGKSSADTQPNHNPPLPEKPSIAVLPFDNMSGDPEQEFFSDGLAEDIITTLSKIERMRVIARNSTFAYKGQSLDLRRIAEELGVRYVLEGSVRRGGNRLRITAQLIDANNASHLWAERYDRPVEDLFDIQDEITKEIVTALRVKLTDGEEAQIWAGGTNNIEAWQCAIRAMEMQQQFTLSSYLEARKLAEKATELDPDYALAWAALSLTYWFEGRLDYTGDEDEKFAKANKLAKRAIDLDDSVPWAIGVNVVCAAPLGRFEEGVKVAQRGFDQYPGNADIRGFLAFALMNAGKYRDAEKHFRAAMSLNPFSPTWYRTTLARALFALEQFKEAEALFHEVLETAPANILAWLYLAEIFVRTGRTTDAENAIAEIRQLAPNLRAHHMPKFLLINDEPAVQRFMNGLRKAGLPD